MRHLLRDLATNTSVMVAAVVTLMAAAAHFGYHAQPLRVQADALSWASVSVAAAAVPEASKGISVDIGGRRYVLTVRPELAR